MFPLLFAAAVAAAPHADAQSALGAFCRDVEMASAVHIGGPDGSDLLKACLIEPSRPASGCARTLGVDLPTVQAIRGRRRFFAVPGDCVRGCDLVLSDRHVTESAVFQGSKYFTTEVVGAYFGVLSATAPEIDRARVRYMLLLGNATERVRRPDVLACLYRRRAALVEHVMYVPAWQAAVGIEATARAILTRAQAHPRIDRVWEPIVLQADPAAPGRHDVQMILENRHRTSITEWKDTRVRISPWLKLALAKGHDAASGHPEIAQPVLSPEPEADRQAYEAIGSARGLQLYWQPSRLREFGWTDDDLDLLRRMLIEALPR
jgi:hypothetical protein